MRPRVASRDQRSGAAAAGWRTAFLLLVHTWAAALLKEGTGVAATQVAAREGGDAVVVDRPVRRQQRRGIGARPVIGVTPVTGGQTRGISTSIQPSSSVAKAH
jgi:hypothetical protein